MTNDSLPDVIAALTTYRQADADGVMVLVSRQACDEAAAYLATAAVRVEKYREALRTLLELASDAMRGNEHYEYETKRADLLRPYRDILADAPLLPSP